MKIARAFALSTLLVAPWAVAQPAAFPVKPIRMIIPFVPGGPNDIVGRAIGRKLQEAFGQPVVIDNRSGANGTLGVGLIAKSPPNGYTIGAGSLGTLGISPSIYPQLGYDAMKDFEHITLTGLAGNALVVHSGVPAKNLKELIALAKQHPGKLNYASVGSASHLMAEMINSMANIRTVHVPYKGASPALVALLAGEVDFFLNAFPGLLPHIKSGKLRALAVTAAKRSLLAPDVPTMMEAGLPGYEASTWYSLVAPAGTPREIVVRLNQAALQALKSQDIVDAFAAMDTEPLGTTPEQTADFVRRDIAKWAKVVRIAGVKPQ
jgi:tripartite-type tricarboxylate transporter receptor subunit TctC